MEMKKVFKLVETPMKGLKKGDMFILVHPDSNAIDFCEGRIIFTAAGDAEGHEDPNTKEVIWGVKLLGERYGGKDESSG